eukprot:9449538-Heterocapsa_arctica.AAC.1
MRRMARDEWELRTLDINARNPWTVHLKGSRTTYVGASEDWWITTQDKYSPQGSLGSWLALLDALLRDEKCG